MSLQSSNPNALFGQLLERLPGTFQYLELVRGRTGFISPSVDYKNLAAPSVSRAASESLNQAWPGGQLRYEAASGEINSGFHDLRGNDDSIHFGRACRTGKEAVAPFFALGRAETAMHQFETIRPSFGANGVKRSAGSINRVAHDERNSTKFTGRNVGMLF